MNFYFENLCFSQNRFLSHMAAHGHTESMGVIGQKLTLLNGVWDRWLPGKSADARLRCVVGSIENSSCNSMGNIVRLDLRIDRYFNWIKTKISKQYLWDGRIEDQGWNYLHRAPYANKTFSSTGFGQKGHNIHFDYGDPTFSYRHFFLDSTVNWNIFRQNVQNWRAARSWICRDI